MRTTRSLLVLVSLLLATRSLMAAEGASLKLMLPEGTKVTAAVAVASGLKVESAGVIDASAITFDKLLPGTPYDVRLTLADGTTIQGVNLGWHSDEEAAADAGPLRHEDRDEILKISAIDPFYNKHDVIALQGDHDRAAALVQLIRDKDFYAGAGQVVWRVEIYYFKNQHGGWEKISQQNKIIRRERFKTHDDCTAALAKIKFLGSLGGLKVDAAKPQTVVKLETLTPGK